MALDVDACGNESEVEDQTFQLAFEARPAASKLLLNRRLGLPTLPQLKV